MSERKYSVDEIGRMRAALGTLITPWNMSYYATEISAKVEDQLRTYMQNGTDPEELERQASETVRQQFAFQDRMRKAQEARGEAVEVTTQAAGEAVEVTNQAAVTTTEETPKQSLWQRLMNGAAGKD